MAMTRILILVEWKEYEAPKLLSLSGYSDQTLSSANNVSWYINLKKILSIGNQVSYFSFTVLFWNYWRTVIGKCNPNHLNKKETKNFRQLNENYGDKEGQITDGPLIFYSLFPSGTLLFLFFSTVFVMKPSVAYPRYCIERSQTVAAITEQSSSWFQLGFRIVASSVLGSS